MGILCRGEDEFAVAELKLFKYSQEKIFADICLFKSAGGEWDYIRVSVLCMKTTDDASPSPSVPTSDDASQLCYWQTDTVIPLGRWLCWIDYYRGILFCDVFSPAPTVTFLRLPLNYFPDTHIRSKESSWLYRGLSAIDACLELRFVSIDRNDGIGYGPLKRHAGFTITCHTLAVRSMVWTKDYTCTSNELWSKNPSLSREILMFPEVDINRPHVVHFLMVKHGYVVKSMWVVTIDMEEKKVESFYQYIDREEDLYTEKADLAEEKSSSPMAFLPCEFSKYINFLRKTKDME